MAYEPNWGQLAQIVENPPPLIEDIVSFIGERISQDPTKTLPNGASIQDLLGAMNGTPTLPNGQAILGTPPVEDPLAQTLPPSSTQAQPPYDWPDLKSPQGSEDPAFNKGQQLIRQFPGGGLFNPNLWPSQPYPGGAESQPQMSSQSPLIGALSQLQDQGSLTNFIQSLFAPAFGSDAAAPYGTQPSTTAPNYDVVGGNGGYGLQFSGGNYTGPIWSTQPSNAQLLTELAKFFGEQTPTAGGGGSTDIPGTPKGSGGGGDPFDPTSSQFWGQGPQKDWNDWWNDPQYGLTEEQKSAARFEYFNDRYFGDNPWSALTGNEDQAWWYNFQNEVEQQQWENWAAENNIPAEYVSQFYEQYHGRKPPWIAGNDNTPTTSTRSTGGTGSPGGGTGGTGGAVGPYQFTPTPLPADARNPSLVNVAPEGTGAEVDAWRQSMAAYRNDLQGRLARGEINDYQFQQLMAEAGSTARPEALNAVGGIPGYSPGGLVMYQDANGNWLVEMSTATAGHSGQPTPSGLGLNFGLGIPTTRNLGKDRAIAEAELARMNDYVGQKAARDAHLARMTADANRARQSFSNEHGMSAAAYYQQQAPQWWRDRFDGYTSPNVSGLQQQSVAQDAARAGNPIPSSVPKQPPALPPPSPTTNPNLTPVNTKGQGDGSPQQGPSPGFPNDPTGNGTPFFGEPSQQQQPGATGSGVPSIAVRPSGQTQSTMSPSRASRPIRRGSLFVG